MIQLARSSDAFELSRLIKAVFGDDVPATHVQSAIISPKLKTYIAIEDDQIIGFVSGFPTLTIEGIQRWELDLIGVHPDFRGRGIASQLVNRMNEMAITAGAHYIRALVSIHNHTMQSVLRRRQYDTNYVEYTLYVLENSDLPSINGLYLVPVTTLTYRGIWLEGDVPSQLGDFVIPKSGQLLGAVVPAHAVMTLQQAQFFWVGNYNWWLFNLKSG